MNDSNDAPMESSGSSSPSGVKPPVNNSLISKTPASVTVALHPLVILNVSDHFTRIRAQGSSLNVYGALLGKQEGRHLELFNSFEMKYSPETGIDMDYFRSKEEQFRQVFKDLDFLGWYTVGSNAPTEDDVKIHQQLITVNEGSLMMKLNHSSKSTNLPVTIYESMKDIIEEQSRMMFIEVTYTLVTEEAERIGVDHVGRVRSTGTSDISQVSEYMQVQRSAIKMLHSRIEIILQYIKAVHQGEIPLDHDIMRECLSLCQRLPVLNTDSFKNDFLELQDVPCAKEMWNIVKQITVTSNNPVCQKVLGTTPQWRSFFSKAAGSSVTTFLLHDNYEMMEGVSLPRNSLYTHYIDFCAKSKIEPVNAASFGKIIRATFPDLKTRRLGTRGQSKYHYYGISVKRTSPYYESVLSAARQSETGYSQSHEKLSEEVKKESKPAPRAASPTDVSTAAALSELNGTILPVFPTCDSINLENQESNEKVKTFLIMYRAHCQRVIDTILRANFSEVQNFLVHFWQGIPSHITSILSERQVIELIGNCDNILYKAIESVLIPGTLQPVPASLTQAIQHFAKQLCIWLDFALCHLPEELQRKKISVARHFSQLLMRQTSLLHLAQAARTVLHNSEPVMQMASDLNEIRMDDLMQQILWIRHGDVVEEYDSLVKFLDEFRALLDQQASIEDFAEWISTLIMRCIVTPSEKEEGAFQTLAQEFLLNWSFFTAKVIQELTLKSAKSFGSFHLLQMLFDEYIFYLIESHADITEESEPPAEKSAKPSESTPAASPTTHFKSSSFRSRFSSSSSGRGSLSPGKIDIGFNLPIDAEQYSSTPRQFAFPYDMPRPHNSIDFNNFDPTSTNPYQPSADPCHLAPTPLSQHAVFTPNIPGIKSFTLQEQQYPDDFEIAQQLQEQTRSLFGPTEHNSQPRFNPYIEQTPLQQLNFDIFAKSETCNIKRFHNLTPAQVAMHM